MASKEPISLLEPLWADYQQGAYGHLLPPGQQFTECKRAFYAGVAKSIMALAHLASDGPEVTSGDIDLIHQLMEETHAFFQVETAIHNAMKN